MSFTVTNQVASPANIGESVTINLNQTDTAARMASIAVGNKVTIGSSSLVGYVTWVDKYGTQFTAAPKNNSVNLASSSTPNQLAPAETITIG